jgi:transcriptional regulator with PAS, ATPase and Fis domain
MGATNLDEFRSLLKKRHAESAYPLDKPSRLADIRGFAQEISMAIAAATNVEVTIVDENLVRVAGTGKYVEELDEVLPEHTISDMVLKTGTYQILEQPRKDPRCAKCAFRSKCREMAEISFPVLMNDKPIANLALIAFTEEQRRLLLDKRQIWIEYLSKMANLMAHKLESNEKTRYLTELKHQLETLINRVDQGIVYIGLGGNILFFNQIAKHYLGDELAVGEEICKLFPDLKWPVNEPAVQIVDRDTGALSISAKPLHGIGALIEVQRISTIQEKEQEIRRRMSSKPHLALAKFSDLVGSHPQFLAAMEIARKYSQVDATVLITAETGTGKELFAQSIHNMSPRRSGPFVAVNCAALPESLLESELFGYVGGAFTGARRGGKVGLFEQAHGGTIFLDEIAEMPFRLQSSLLRVLQHKEVMRIGDDKLIPVDVRIITATNKNLRELVEQGRFREDLYYRLDILRIKLPPLRDRKEDIPLLVQHFAIQGCRQFAKKPVAFSKEGMKRLYNYHWPGNVRELYNVVQRAVLLAEKPIVDVDLLDEILEQGIMAKPGDRHRFEVELTGNYQNIQRQMIRQLMDIYGDEEEIMKLLGLSRTTIWRRLNSK